MYGGRFMKVSNKELFRLAKALSRDLQGNPEDSQDWEWDLVKRIMFVLKETIIDEEHICDFCKKPFTDGFSSNALNQCRKCYSQDSNIYDRDDIKNQGESN
jgi:hypothetical protein